MSMLHDLIEKYATKESELELELEEARKAVEELEAQLREVQVVRAALEAGGDDVEPAPRRQATAKTTSRTTRETPSPDKRPATRAASKPARRAARPAKPAKPAKPARKGRRIAADSPATINEMGIVDAAIALARQRDQTEADAGEILRWFQEAGYKSRSGMPTRNSIYVSLNREFTEGEKRGRRRITRPERGKFVFHFDEDEA